MSDGLRPQSHGDQFLLPIAAKKFQNGVILQNNLLALPVQRTKIILLLRIMLRTYVTYEGFYSHLMLNNHVYLKRSLFKHLYGAVVSEEF